MSWDFANFLVQAVAAGLGAVAIVAAVGAQTSIARERRRQFELQILTEILTAAEETDLLDDVDFNPSKLRRYQRRLNLIEDPPSYWMRVMSADWYEEVVPEAIKRQRELSVRHGELVTQRGDDPNNQVLYEEDMRVQDELHAVAREVKHGVPRKLINQLEEAIKVRTDARDHWWSWRR